MEFPELRYFQASEFRDWAHLMSHELLYVLDEFRHLWGAPVTISPAQGVLGRRDNSKSFHNVNYHGSVLAADIFPRNLERSNFRDAVTLAEEAGAKGIGLYPDWSRPGMHLDVGKRGGDGMGYWAGVGRPQKYVAISRVY